MQEIFSQLATMQRKLDFEIEERKKRHGQVHSDGISSARLEQNKFVQSNQASQHYNSNQQQLQQTSW